MSQPTPSPDPQGQQSQQGQPLNEQPQAGQPQAGQQQFGQPQYGQQYDSAQYGQPQYDPSQHDPSQSGQQQYGQPQYDPSQYDPSQYGQPQYDPAQYGQQQYDPAQYGQQPQYGQQQFPGQAPVPPGYAPVQGRPAPQPTPLVANQDYSAAFAPQEVEEGKFMSIVGYLGILFLLPMLALPNNRFARFHANQGLVNLLAAIALGLASSVLRAVLGALDVPLLGGLIGWLATLAPMVLGVLGMINAGSGKAKTLPLIGNFQLLK